MARRMVGRLNPKLSARLISLGSFAPGPSCPEVMAFSSSCATWKYSGMGLDRSRSIASSVIVPAFRLHFDGATAPAGPVWQQWRTDDRMCGQPLDRRAPLTVVCPPTSHPDPAIRVGTCP